MKKNISRNPLWPDWYNGKKIDEVQFGRAFLEQWPLKCVNGTLYTLDGPVEDESEIKQRILENIEEYVTSGLSKKVTNILETIKLLAFSDPFPIEQDCIHLQNGVYHLPDGSFQESRLFCQNRLPVRYDPKAASPDRWLTFLHELLDDADIPTLQEYLGYCLIPSTKGQKMMLIVGKGGEGKSRIGLVLKRLMGDAASNGSVQKVENNRFARADLERRLLMIDDDMDMNALPFRNFWMISGKERWQQSLPKTSPDLDATTSKPERIWKSSFLNTVSAILQSTMVMIPTSNLRWILPRSETSSMKCMPKTLPEKSRVPFGHARKAESISPAAHRLATRKTLPTTITL